MIDLPESRILWAICSKFKVLPNDPLVRDLSVIQRLWIVANMNQDYDNQERAINGKSQSITVDSGGTDMATLRSLMGMAKAHGG